MRFNNTVTHLDRSFIVCVVTAGSTSRSAGAVKVHVVLAIYSCNNKNQNIHNVELHV